MNRPYEQTIHWKAVEQCFTVVLFVFQFYPVCNFVILDLDLALSGVKGSMNNSVNISIRGQ